MKDGYLKPLKFTVAFDEADGEGVVFFGNYFRLAHRALEQFIPQLGIPWEEWFKNEEWAVPLRHVECDYLQPLRPGDEFTAHIHVSNVGESSVRFTYELRNAEGKPTAHLTTAHVFVARKTFKKAEIPQSVRERLERVLRILP
jgi:1,4-dihydroxy-2-naphthoyl-CoA hydrolase